tara:strand:+ start:34 stop:441 length:408 start_codon:yes stop_codon:yes gene_type:complete
MEDLPLEERLNRSFDQQEKAEEKALELEKLIKSYNGAAPLMPTRKYGQPVEDIVPNFGLTLKSIIESENPRLAAYLNISTGYHKRIEEETRRRQEYIDNFKAKTEELQLKNAEQKHIREQRIIRGLDPTTGRPLI